MLLTDVYFMFTILTLAVLFTIAVFIWKAMWWFGLAAGFLWMLLGLWGMQTMSNPVITLQREMSLVFIVVGIGVIFLPFYINRKETKSIDESSDEIDEYINEYKGFNKQRNKYRSMRQTRDE